MRLISALSCLLVVNSLSNGFAQCDFQSPRFVAQLAQLDVELAHDIDKMFAEGQLHFYKKLKQQGDVIDDCELKKRATKMCGEAIIEYATLLRSYFQKAYQDKRTNFDNIKSEIDSSARVHNIEILPFFDAYREARLKKIKESLKIK